MADASSVTASDNRSKFHAALSIDPLATLLANYSVEITVRDQRSLLAARDSLEAGTEVFVVALPNDSSEQLVAAAARLRRDGLVPVPHVVARNITSLKAADELLARLADAGVDRVLSLGGDRDEPAGVLTESLQIIQSGLLQRRGIRRFFLACYPEGHPKITDAQLHAARHAKLRSATEQGLEATLVSQYCFQAQPVIELARRLRAEGIPVALRVGVAGPADCARLLKYAMLCGVGASIRFLKNKPDLAKGVLGAETPESLLTEVARAQAADPALQLTGVHFFTFGNLINCAQWANDTASRRARSA
jgi:methylenetetrahydrofolate reductase (NADPH)